MICPECNNEFFSTHWNAKYCNVRCKDRAFDKKRRERARTGELPAAQKHAVKTGAALEAVVQEAERLERLMRGEKDTSPRGSDSIDYFTLKPKKDI